MTAFRSREWLLATLFLLLSASAFSQDNLDDIINNDSHYKNFVKWEFTNLIVGTFSVSYDRHFNLPFAKHLNPFSIEVGGGLQLPWAVNHLFGTMKLDDGVLSGGYEYFIIPKYMLMEFRNDYFVVGTMYRYRRLFVDGGNDVQYRDFGALIGNELTIHGGLGVSYLVGFGWRAIKEIQDSNQEPDTDSHGLFPFSIKLSYRF